MLKNKKPPGATLAVKKAVPATNTMNTGASLLLW